VAPDQVSHASSTVSVDPGPAANLYSIGSTTRADCEGMAHTTIRQTSAKHALNTYCQRVLRRQMSKADVVYDLAMIGDWHQAFVTLACMDGLTFAGDLARDRKTAVESVASKALDFLGLTADLPSRTQYVAFTATSGTPRTSNRAMTPKVVLGALCLRVAQRNLVKNDIVYNSWPCMGGFQATVTVPVLPGKWRKKQWTGGVSESKRTAEHSAADVAISFLSTEGRFASILKRHLRLEDCRPRSTDSLPTYSAGSSAQWRPSVSGASGPRSTAAVMVAQPRAAEPQNSRPTASSSSRHPEALECSEAPPPFRGGNASEDLSPCGDVLPACAAST